MKEKDQTDDTRERGIAVLGHVSDEEKRRLQYVLWQIIKKVKPSKMC